MPSQGTAPERNDGQSMEPPPDNPATHPLPNLPQQRPRTPAAVTAAWIIVAAAAAVLAGHTAWATYESHWGTPSCSWPLQVRGKATGDQPGLVRCYLKALAEHNTAGLMAVADNDPAVRITSADLTNSADARAGLATATFTPSPDDTTVVLLTITYADGVTEKTAMQNLIAMGGPSIWRMAVGTPIVK